MASYLVPAYSALWPFLELKLDLAENLNLLGFLIALLLFTGLVAGSYPAFYISNFQPDTILRGTVKFSGTNLLSRILLVLQFSISLIAIVSGFIFARNAAYQEAYDLGFDMESVIYTYVKNEQGYNALRSELMGEPKIKSMSGSAHNVTSSWYTDPIKYQSDQLDVSILDIGAGYLSTIGATIIKGRDFVENSQTDAERSVIINEELARTFGWPDPLGQRIVLRDTVELFVVGVVKDIYIEGSLWDPLEPMLMRYSKPEFYRFLSVSVNEANLREVKLLMDSKWKVVFPNELSTVEFMSEQRAESLLVNTNIKMLFLFLGFFAILLSVIGLFSLVSLNLNKRMKEIGIRKILGASVGNLGLKLSMEFLIILTVASVIGSVSAYFLTDLLMGSIWTYYIRSTPPIIVLGVLILLSAGGLTIAGRVLKVITTIPASFLRDE